MLNFFVEGCAPNDKEVEGTERYLLLREGLLVSLYSLSEQLARRIMVDIYNSVLFIFA